MFQAFGFQDLMFQGLVFRFCSSFGLCSQGLVLLFLLAVRFCA
jgi:hypothetical protein